MGVRIVTICIMDGEVGAHPFRNTFFQHKLVQHCLPVLHGQLRWQRNNQLAGKPTVFCFFGLFYRIPESLPICPFSRSHIGQQYLGKQNARFLRIIMGNTVIIVVKLLAALICCGGNSRAPSATADDFRFKVVDCRFYHLAFRTCSRPSSCASSVFCFDWRTGQSKRHGYGVKHISAHLFRAANLPTAVGARSPKGIPPPLRGGE